MAVKRYDGSAWQTVAGLGAQGPAATSSSIATWVKTASGGETSLSGNDDNSQSLSYTVGQELVFINGTLLKRGSDYTATNGTSITGLTALAANDVATVWTVNAFSVTNAISNTLVDAKGDLIVATAADTPARLAVGSNGQYLKADSTAATGLAWATLPSSGKVLQVVSATSTTDTTVSSTSYTDTTLTASITPSATTSKVLILVSQQITSQRFDQATGGGLQIVRGATSIRDCGPNGYEAFWSSPNAGANNIIRMIFNVSHLDSPSTTSSTTYKTQIKAQTTANSGYAQAQQNGTTSSIILLEIGA